MWETCSGGLYAFGPLESITVMSACGPDSVALLFLATISLGFLFSELISTPHSLTSHSRKNEGLVILTIFYIEVHSNKLMKDKCT